MELAAILGSNHSNCFSLKEDVQDFLVFEIFLAITPFCFDPVMSMVKMWEQYILCMGVFSVRPLLLSTIILFTFLPISGILYS